MALADKHMIVKERLKHMRTGTCVPTTCISFFGEGIYGSLNTGGFIIWPVANSLSGK